MNKIFYTCCSNNFYQYFIPAYAYFLNKAYPDCQIIVEGMSFFKPEIVISIEKCKNVFLCDFPSGNIIPELPSSYNLSRFLKPPNYEPPFYGRRNVVDILNPKKAWDYCLITDIDLLLFNIQDHWDWHIEKMKELNSCYYAHHGPYKWPNRFPGGWKKDKERLAGGFVLITPEWVDKTQDAREKYYKLLINSEIGLYREEDEVTLCKICKESGLPISYDKYFPPMLRGIHLGDFRPDMKHRYTNMAKMQSKLAQKICEEYAKINETDSQWQEIKKICCIDDTVKKIFENLDSHITRRLA